MQPREILGATAVRLRIMRVIDLDPASGHDADIDEVAMLQTAAATVALIDKHDVAAPGNSTTAIIHAVDRRIVLIMTSDHRERESFKIRRTRILFHSGIHSFATAF